jgi:hypothetical protein
MSKPLVAWDIETCPRPDDELSPAHRERHKSEYQYRRRRADEEPTDEIKRQAQGMHPFLGWITCIAVAPGTTERVGTPRAWSATSPDEEGDLLETFWTFVDDKIEAVRWVTFNGKRFDVPFLKGSSMRHGIVPTRGDLLDTYPYSQDPHADLNRLMESTYYSLGGLCDHLGVENPKHGMSGSDVAEAAEEGRHDDIREYCKQDTVATLRCAQETLPFMDL